MRYGNGKLNGVVWLKCVFDPTSLLLLCTLGSSASTSRNVRGAGVAASAVKLCVRMCVVGGSGRAEIGTLCLAAMLASRARRVLDSLIVESRVIGWVGTRWMTRSGCTWWECC